MIVGPNAAARISCPFVWTTYCCSVPWIEPVGTLTLAF
jgi:hypothetical protein